MELGFATEWLSRPRSARQAVFAEPEPGLGRQAWCNSFKHTQPSSAGLPPSPTSDIKPSHVFHSARSARQRGKEKKKNAPPFFSLGWQHPLLRAVNSGDFSAQLGVQKRTATGTRAYGGINPSPCLPATLLAYSQPICRCEDLILYNWDSKCI